MQRASRYFCPTAPQFSPSNITLRTRKRSRTSSTGSDSLALSRGPGNAGDASRTKPRSTKSDLRSISSNLKNARKPKAGKTPKPNFRGLQNAIVLAPFHTLKKCFQNKLVDLYSFEKMKKINYRTKMAKKKNMSFEYDIIELKPTGREVKKEEKAAKKLTQKSRSVSYCQCKKKRLESEGAFCRQNCSKGSKMRTRKNPGSQVLRHSCHIERQKRKPSFGGISPMTLKSELSPGVDFCPPDGRFFFPQNNSRPSAKSSRSKCNSWETYSNAPSCKEEHMEGSLAISTTSFDSCLEHFDKNSWNYSDSCRRCRKQTKYRKTAGHAERGFPPKPEATASRHLIMHVERKKSDGQIVDFMDREPQTEVISPAESNKHLQPLRRQSKTKNKKLENEPATSYYLRSLSSSKEILAKGNQNFLFPERCEGRSSAGNPQTKNKALQMEVATQVEGQHSEKDSNNSLLKNSQESSANAHCKSAPLEQAPEEPLEPPNPHSSDEKIEPSPRESVGNLKLPCEVPSPPSFDPLANQVEDVEDQRTEMRLNLAGHSDRGAIELMAGLRNQFLDPTNSRRHRGRDSDFIFGPRDTEASLGESCEFSFGLNLVFSDDED